MKLLTVPYIDQTGAGAFTGCESVTAVMLLQYLGKDIGVYDFIDNYLDKADFKEEGGILYGPNPWETFAGNPYDTEAMGCYAPVICRSLERVLGPDYEIKDETGRTISELCERYIDRDMPVVIWSTIELKDIVMGPEWKLFSTGETFVWRSNEHCLLLVGYDETRYYLNDPWKNAGLISCEKALLEDRFRKQYSQAIGVVKRAQP